MIVTNGSGNGGNAIIGMVPGTGEIMIRKIGMVAGRRGPGTVGPRNKVMGGRTSVRVSGMVPLSPRAKGKAEIEFRVGSKGGMEVTIGDKGRVWCDLGKKALGNF